MPDRIEESHGRADRSRSSAPVNVIVFMIDDCGREYLKCYDQVAYNPPAPAPRVDPLTGYWANQWGEIAQDRSRFLYPPTPWIESLAKRGLLLERMNVAAMCSPTRCSLLTGRNNQEHTIGNAITGAEIPAYGYVGETVYSRMERLGAPHAREHVGKWHSSNSYRQFIDGRPLGRRNSQASFGTPVKDGGATHYSGGVFNFGPSVPGYEFPEGGQNHHRYVKGDHDGETGEFHMELMTSHSLWDETQAAIDGIQRARATNRPFLMNVWFHAVHTPTDWGPMGGAILSRLGLHDYGTRDPGDESLRVSAFVQSVDNCCRLIDEALTPAERANTMFVFVSDNGSTATMLDSTVNPSLPPAGPGANPYLPSHSKRSPWQGGIGAACVIAGPLVANPGDGSTPRVWNGLVGIEDLHEEVCRWVGVPLEDGSGFLHRALDDTAGEGRRSYTKRAFQNGFADDIFSEGQGNSVRFISEQNHDGWKLLWIRAGRHPTPVVRWEWQLYDMTRDPIEAIDVFPPDTGGESIQSRYGRLATTPRRQFNELYVALEEQNLIPPGMQVELF